MLVPGGGPGLELLGSPQNQVVGENVYMKNDHQDPAATTNTGPITLPVLPLRDIIVFPHMAMPLFVGRTKSIAALEYAMSRNREIMLTAQKKAATNAPDVEDLYWTGTLGTIVQMLRLPDSTVKVLVEGKARLALDGVVEESAPCMLVNAHILEEPDAGNLECQALMRSLRSSFETYVKFNRKVTPEVFMGISAIDEPSRFADMVAGNLQLKFSDKQAVLEILDVEARLEKILELLQAEIEILQVEKKIKARVRKQVEKSQKEYYLNEQMQAIQKELGDRDDLKTEIYELEERIKSVGLSAEARDKVEKELRKLKMMAPMSAEATVVRNYIDWILYLPWDKVTAGKLDIEEAAKVLDEDHYGLDKAKERILEFLAVEALAKKHRSPILCLVGPPGVGKTSLAKSIARATGKDYVRLSLGGVRDEAEIRGHRRTYIGSMPGKIIQSLKKAGSNNPVFLLDEIDKMSADFRGDPASALLEVLDPEQNYSFNDHYLDLDYDLSQVMFLTTANNLHAIPPALSDRLEIIQLSGYTEFEKVKIAQQYLISKQMTANGIDGAEVSFSEDALRLMVNEYTREAGVRNLEREIASICRKIARQLLKKGELGKVRVGKELVRTYLGAPKYHQAQTDKVDLVGVANGLAVTAVGGDLLTTEAIAMPGSGKLIVTGKLGDVMQESVQAAMSYVRSRAELLGLDRDFQQNTDIHVHCPEGAIPKDGPSAGITMATAMVSVLSGIPLSRNLAMTGEITLRGRVLEVGGVKEKILAAHRAGVTKVLIPFDNEKDLKDIPQKVCKALEIIPVLHMDQVLEHALGIQSKR